MSPREGRRRSRDGHLMHIGDVLGPTLEKIGPRTLWTEAKIRRAWPAIVGPEVARHAGVRRLRGSTLVVEVSSDAWATEFSYLSRVVMQKLHGRFGEKTVTEIVVAKGRSSSPEGKP